MLDIANDIQSLSYFKRNTTEALKRMKDSGHPIILTVNGKAEMVVQDAVGYQRLMARAEKAETVEFLRETLADADAGRTVPAREFLESLGKRKKGKRR